MLQVCTLFVITISVKPFMVIESKHTLIFLGIPDDELFQWLRPKGRTIPYRGGGWGKLSLDIYCLGKENMFVATYVKKMFREL